MTNKTKYHGKKYFYRYCLQCFSYSKVLECHVEICLVIQDQIFCSCSCKLIHVADRYSKPCKTYFGEDAIDKFSNDMIKESKYYSKVIETEFNKPLNMTQKDYKYFQSSTKYWICKKAKKK